MQSQQLQRRAGVLLLIASLWITGGALALVLTDQIGITPQAQAQSQNPCNPCNPCKAKPANPCNPCNPCKAKPANPCNPCKAKANPCNPCNPCKAKPTNPCNPCNPCKAKPANPCNPCNPCKAKSANPCNPCNPCSGGRAAAGAAKLSFGTNYRDGGFEKTTGHVQSASHGDRLVVTWVNPAAAAKVYRENAQKVRNKQTSGFKVFPAGTTIVKESYVKNANGSPGARGPLFVMKKEAPGYDPSGGDWRYGFADEQMRSIGEGFTGPVAFCKACHLTMKGQDFVFAVDR